MAIISLESGIPLAKLKKCPELWVHYSLSLINRIEEIVGSSPPPLTLEILNLLKPLAD
jgi:hypothetical protein